MDQDAWFSVRCVFEVDPTYGARGEAPPSHLFEERITLWRTASLDTALNMAVADAEVYCKDVGGRYLGLAQAFALFEAPGHGVEIFSLMRASDLGSEDYVERHFAAGSEREA